MHEIQKSDVGVISSNIETFSVAGIEFMSQGLPVISTDCGGPNDFINDNNGIIVDKDDIKEMSNAMLEMTNREFDSNKIKSVVKGNFSEDIIISKLISIYQDEN